jgi:di/tripeptidase
MKLLEQLYFIHSPSKGEKAMSKFIRKYLQKIGITDFEVLGNQIYRVKSNTILLAAHMDQVQTEQCEKLFIRNKNEVHGDKGIGADDKNGIWIILNLLKKFKDISFIFSDQEECGGNIKTVFQKIDKEDSKKLATIKYSLVFDRRSGSDIIGKLNSYCESDLLNAVETLGKEFGYKTTQGMWSDCDQISLYVPCVNLSCGYYDPHTNT